MGQRFRTPLACLIALAAFVGACGEDATDTALDDELLDGDMTAANAGDRAGWPPAAVWRRIVFASGVSRRDIYIVDADGANQKRIRSSPESDYHTAVSPDGKRIAFVSRRDDATEVFVMDADGRHAKNYTNHPWDDKWPAWSPDGSRIAFVS